MSQLFEKAMGIIAWLQIVASPLLFGGIIGACIYFPNPNNFRLIIALGLVILGLVIGILYANKIWKTKGTMWFVSQISSTPEIDNQENKEESNRNTK